MAKNSREGNQNRNKRYREALAERGVRPVQVFAPEAAHPLIRQAAGLMTRNDDPLEPRAAFRQVGGANEPEPDKVSSDLVTELEAARTRLIELERQAEAQQSEIDETKCQRAALEAELTASRVAEVAERERAKAAEQKAIEADRKAWLAQAPVRRIRAMRGLRGRVARWITDINPKNPGSP